MTGFGSSRRSVSRFQSSGRKSGLGPKFSEAKMIFFLFSLMGWSGAGLSDGCKIVKPAKLLLG